MIDDCEVVDLSTHLLDEERRAEILAALQTETPGGPVEPGQLDADQLCHITVRLNCRLCMSQQANEPGPISKTTTA